MFDKELAVRNGKVVYRSGDSAIKVFDIEKDKADVLNEALNQARVEHTGINIPKIKNVTCLEDGRWALAMDYIEGVTLEELIKANPAMESEYLEKFVELQLEMHAQRVPLLNKLKDKMSRKIAETKLSATIKYELDNMLEGMPKHNKLCHGDLNPSNIIVEKSTGKYFVIDWSHATQGNASADTARTYLILTLSNGKEFADKYLDMFCNKSNTAKQYVMKWLPIVAASQSVKGIKEEQALLNKWIDVVQYE